MSKELAADFDAPKNMDPGRIWNDGWDAGFRASRDVIVVKREGNPYSKEIVCPWCAHENDAAATDPDRSATCWRSECRNRCYYPDVCTERTRPIQPGASA